MLSSGFSVYQWWSSAKDEHVRAAIEISDRYIDQAVDADLMRNEFNSGTLSSMDMTKVRNQDARLAYIAFLANRGLVDSAYISQRVVCDIIQTADTDPEASKFKNNHKSGCPDSAAAAGQPTDLASPKSN